MDQRPRFDALIVFGYGPVRPCAAPHSGKLSLYGRLNALAAGMLFHSHEIHLLVATGGRTGGHDRPSEAALIARVLRAKFNVPGSRILLEEQATDTLFNVAHVVNLIDRSSAMRRLALVAMGYHLPRIREICSLVGLDGEFTAAEEVVSTRSARHQRLVQRLIRPEVESYARILEDQERGWRGLRQMPEYWLPPLSTVDNAERLRRILKAERVQPFLQSHGIDVERTSPDGLRAWLGSIPRQCPS